MLKAMPTFTFFFDTKICFGMRAQIFECMLSLTFCVMPDKQRSSKLPEVSLSFIGFTFLATTSDRNQLLLLVCEGGVCLRVIALCQIQQDSTPAGQSWSLGSSYGDATCVFKPLLAYSTSEEGSSLPAN